MSKPMLFMCFIAFVAGWHMQPIMIDWVNGLNPNHTVEQGE